jgi:hypothetical protein
MLTEGSPQTRSMPKPVAVFLSGISEVDFIA